MPDSAGSEKKGNGRPSFAPSDADRDLARGLAADGADDPAIAEALEISLPTLRKHLGDDIAAGRSAISPGLFGDEPAQADHLIPPPSSAPAAKRGRPKYRPTMFDREKVRMLAAAGISIPVIAVRMSISVPTLARAYRDDLETARETAKAQIVEELVRQMRGGSTSAADKLRTMIDEADLASMAARRAAAPVEVKPEKETLGKKVHEARAAEKAGATGKWARLSEQNTVQ